MYSVLQNGKILALATSVVYYIEVGYSVVSVSVLSAPHKCPASPGGQGEGCLEVLFLRARAGRRGGSKGGGAFFWQSQAASELELMIVLQSLG